MIPNQWQVSPPVASSPFLSPQVCNASPQRTLNLLVFFLPPMGGVQTHILTPPLWRSKVLRRF